MKFKLAVSAAALAAIALFDSGCAVPEEGSYQDRNVYQTAIYNEMTRTSFQYEGPVRNPVIVIHGLLGARLDDPADGTNVWGHFSYSEMVSGKYFDRLAHPMRMGVPLHELKSATVPSGLLGQSEVRILGVQFYLDNYDILVNSLSECGYVPEGLPLPGDKHFYSQFIFYYDWRRDISENAVALDKFIREKREYLQRRYKSLYGLEDFDVQFDLVSHSMGGLLARYYLRYGGRLLPEKESENMTPDWSGSKFVDKVVVIGTPNSGYVDTLLEMARGLRLVPGAPPYPPALLGTFVSYYEMLPNAEGEHVRNAQTGEPVDYFNIQTWIDNRWGLADPAQDEWLAKILPDVKIREERRKIALDHLEKCLVQARKFKKAMRIGANEYPPDVAVWLLAGNSVETNATVDVDSRTGEIQIVKKTSGDGKIPFASACQDLRDGGIWLPFMLSPVRWSAVYPLPGGHMGIMNSEQFDATLRLLLLDTPTRGQIQRQERYTQILRSIRLP